MTALTQARLQELLHYDPQTGVWTWKVDRNGGAYAGAIAGGFNSEGYRRIYIDGRRYHSSRLAYFYMKGHWPPVEMDHRDLTPSNDAWSNLRPASLSENRANCARRADNSTGFKGVNFVRKRFQARIMLNRKSYHLGLFNTPELAHRAYIAAAAQLHGEFARGG
jgi:hypothetical protein